MDFESLLFKLKPIIDPKSIGDFNYNEASVSEILETLDKCSQSARIENNREILGQSGLLISLRDTLRLLLGDVLEEKNTTNALYKLQICSEIIRILANSFADNDHNRSLFLDTGDNDLFFKHFGLIFQSNENEGSVFIDLQLRLAAMTKNLIIENEDYINRYGKPLVPFCVYRLDSIDITNDKQQQLALFTSELIDTIMEYNKDLLSLNMVFQLVTFCSKISKHIIINNVEIDEADDEEPFIEMISSITGIIENSLEINGRYNYRKEIEVTHDIQSRLLSILDDLADLKFHNKLIIMRRLVTSVGFVASDSNNDNQNELKLALDTLKLGRNFPYTNAAALIILSNYVDSAERAKSLESEITIDQLIQKAKNMSDPVQFQGFLDLLKKLASLSNMMFVSDQTINDIISILTYSNDQGQYFQGLIPLINSLLNKLLTTLPATKVQKIFTGPNSEPFINLILKNGSITACLALDKLLIGKEPIKDSIEKRLWESVLQFDEVLKESQTDSSVFLLFQVTKTVGVYLRNVVETSQENILIPKYTKKLIYLLQVILDMKNTGTKNIESAANNGKFVAGMLLTYLNSQEFGDDEDTLQNLCKSYF